ncbi:unnamed protein product [Adineta ricciae]|uniref:Uncharacterized protein n=1 Tax=Adineta ricciae TaxID=249248 RepID=A0A816BRM7_ADIRI|nr:unnamed protein product [Adineta ricciae]CAF1613582.1 unnamed protein product [Adineta ricciae]
MMKFSVVVVVAVCLVLAMTIVIDGFTVDTDSTTMYIPAVETNNGDVQERFSQIKLSKRFASRDRYWPQNTELVRGCGADCGDDKICKNCRGRWICVPEDARCSIEQYPDK